MRTIVKFKAVWLMVEIVEVGGEYESWVVEKYPNRGKAQAALVRWCRKNETDV